MIHSLFQRPSSYPSWALILFSVVSTASANTAIVSMRLNDRVIVGADRKVAKTEVEPEHFLCKIEKGDGFFFAWAGTIYRGGHGGPTFNPATVINSVPISGTIEDKINAIEPRLKESYVTLWNAYRLARFSDYETKQKGFTVIFFGMEASIPIVIGLEFRPTTSLFEVPFEAKSIWSKCPGDCRSSVLMAGNRKAVDRFLDDNPGYLGRAEPIQAIRKFVQLEAEDVPEDVGGGIDIITVGSDGPCWTSHEAKDGPEIPDCAEPTPRPSRLPTSKPTPRPSGVSSNVIIPIVALAVALGLYVVFFKRKRQRDRKRVRRTRK